MEYKTLTWSIHPNPRRPEERCIGLLKFNRPDRLNAVDPDMRVELDALLDEIRWNSHVKVVILTGEGRAFSGGGDIRTEGGPLEVTGEEMGITGPYKKMAEYFFNDLRHQVLQRALRKLEDLPQVTIAAINGWAVGVGLEMCTLCDIRIASDQAQMAEVAVIAGFLPECGGARNLPKLVGVGKALEMILTGRTVEAEEALRIGLVDRVVPDGELLEEAFRLAGQLSLQPYLSVRLAKSLVKMYWNWNRSEEGYRRELESVLEVTRTKDCQEGIRAFLEKRDPQYRGPYYAHWPFGGDGPAQAKAAEGSPRPSHGS
jgi:enoyl-CoA hydratase/carnithine racemase